MDEYHRLQLTQLEEELRRVEAQYEPILKKRKEEWAETCPITPRRGSVSDVESGSKDGDRESEAVAEFMAAEEAVHQVRMECTDPITNTDTDIDTNPKPGEKGTGLDASVGPPGAMVTFEKQD